MIKYLDSLWNQGVNKPLGWYVNISKRTLFEYLRKNFEKILCKHKKYF